MQDVTNGRGVVVEVVVLDDVVLSSALQQNQRGVRYVVRNRQSIRWVWEKIAPELRHR